ncbi:TetR/AcrR family transcriptional regulator [Dactylosporangium sucinum]|uniref:TetR family transcriptional regulator n=1 Tax=Dactylosporangium sucinum TaxID=1424081 RepID=A0A917X1Y5_9ACTN|nr:TetR/AcrR family transcriptional regulator [Dactylosporangium sucinum]GGM54829.1 TetR family transcriptional regulator [Dactylosporangium sucinum]
MTPTAEPRRRDAAATRLLLLRAARRRFAGTGYAATTVREVADDAGVNVALISRYFESKEGLFAACLADAVAELRRTTGEITFAELPEAIAARVADAGPDGRPSEVLMLLLRSSGDERADAIRRRVLRSYAERLVAAAGGDQGDDDAVLRAELLLAASMGVVLFRSSGLEPLAAAGPADLVGPLRALVGALLTPRSAG